MPRERYLPPIPCVCPTCIDLQVDDEEWPLGLEDPPPPRFVIPEGVELWKQDWHEVILVDDALASEWMLFMRKKPLTAGYKVKDGRLWFEHRLCIPHSLLPQLVESVHRVHHLGVKRTFVLMQKRYCNFTQSDVGECCQKCLTCQATKSRTGQVEGLMKSSPAPIDLFREVAMDFVDMPQVIVGNVTYSKVLTIVDRFSHFVMILPMSRCMLSGQKGFWLFFNRWVCMFGLPVAIQTDNDSLFVNKFWNGMWQRLGVRVRHSVPYRPQGNGLVEGMNGKCINSLKAWLCDHPSENWMLALPIIVWSMNSAPVVGEFSPNEIEPVIV